MQKTFVLGVKHEHDARENAYYLLTEVAPGSLRVVSCKSKVVLNVGELLFADFDKGVVSAVKQGTFTEKEKEKMIETAFNEVQKKVKKSKGFGNTELDKITRAMSDEIVRAAKLFIRKVVMAAPIVIRFHNDADGASGAYCIYKALEEVLSNEYFAYKPKIFWRMQKGVSYSIENANEEIMTINNYESYERALLLITDFGTSPDSNKGIRAVDKKFDIIWLDHHPIESGFNVAGMYISPWLFGGDSNYTAGFLACEFSKTFGRADFSCMQSASLCGDYSIFYKPDKCGQEMADLLDLLTSYKRIAVGSFDDNLTPADIDNILRDENKKEELLDYARMHMSQYLDSAIASVKGYKGKVRVYVLDFKKLRNSDDNGIKYPLPGRFASKLIEKIYGLKKEPCILLLHFGVYISIRASKDAAEIVDLLSMVKELKGEFADIVAAGGHKSALSIKLANDDEKRSVINAILGKIGVKV